MKNNSLAMLAMISIAFSLASLIGYVDPAVCTNEPADGFVSCEQAAAEHVWAFWGFFTFGVVTLVFGAIRSRRTKAKA